MDVKKSFKADLRNKRTLLLEIGLVAALGMVVAAFNITPKEYRIQKIVQVSDPVVVDIVAVTREKPVEEPRKVQVSMIPDVLRVIDNDSKIETNINYDVFNGEVMLDLVPVKAEKIDDSDDIFLKAETMPTFQGGDLEAFRAWVMQNVKFPQLAVENNIQGRVVLSFVVDKDGRITGIEVLQAPDRSLADEAVRVLNKSPKWSPGKQRNQTVRVRYTLPVDFRLQN